MAETATLTRRRASEKSSQRDPRGRYLRGVSGNARGRPPITPEMKAVRELAAAERTSNIARLVHLRDHAKDAWLQLEATRVLLQYSDGKPALIHTGAPLVNVNLTGASPAGPPANGIDAVVELAADDGSMSPEYRERLLADVFARAERAAARAAERRAAIDVQQEPALAEIPERTAAAAAPAIAAPAPAVEAGVMTEADIEPQELPPAVQAARDAWHAERAADRGEA